MHGWRRDVRGFRPAHVRTSERLQLPERNFSTGVRHIFTMPFVSATPVLVRIRSPIRATRLQRNRRGRIAAENRDWLSKRLVFLARVRVFKGIAEHWARRDQAAARLSLRPDSLDLVLY